MPDSTRPHPAERPEGGPDHDATIESLLVSGLDSYFKGEYDRAIHAWTRVLFLDRSHARARAYIDRARAILAERQRESDQLLHEALSAFDRGDTAVARDLLERAVAQGANEAQALALRDRLERLELPAPRRSIAVPAPPPPPRAAAPAVQRRERASSWPVMVACLVAGVVLALAWPRFVDWAASEVSPPAAGTPSGDTLQVPVPASADLLIERAGALVNRGQLHEALALLDGIGIGDPRRPDADRLRADIQRVLLAGAGTPAAGQRAGRTGADGSR